jgi:hypothetical protein
MQGQLRKLSLPQMISRTVTLTKVMFFSNARKESQMPHKIIFFIPSLEPS